jgi:glutathione S-transferase
MIQLYGVSPSPYVRKVLTCLELKGLNYQQTDVMPMATPEDFINISPLRKVPAIQDGDFTVSDSSVICEYLEDRYPHIATRPTEAEDKARARWLEEFADSKLAELAGGIFFERYLKPLMMQAESNEERVTHIIEELLPPQLDYLETQLPKQDFLFGKTLMVADIALITHFINAAYAGYQIDETRWPQLCAYIERVKAHPVVAKRLAAEAEYIAANT